MKGVAISEFNLPFAMLWWFAAFVPFWFSIRKKIK